MAIFGPCVDEQAKKADLQSKAGKWSWESSRDATQRGIKAGNQAARAVCGVPGASRLSRGPMFFWRGSHEAPLRPRGKSPVPEASVHGFCLGSQTTLPKS